MKRDTTRETFDRRRHFSSVRQQQGRVQLDAEWNEQADIVTHRIETETLDTLGTSGVPCHDGGFAVEPTADGDLIITPGRIYVDGVLCQLDPEELPVAEISAAGTRLRVAPGALVAVRLDIDDWVEIFDDRPDGVTEAGLRTRVTAVDPAADLIDVAEDASATAAFERPTVRRLPTYSTQADRPTPVPMPSSPDEDGTYLVYLDVWRRHVGVLEAPSIRESALGGPDTATREQVLSQVRLLRFDGDDDGSPHCLSRPPVWRRTIAPSSGRLRARTQPAPPAPDPCEVPPGGGYTRLENQHYRVEVHRGGSRDQVQLKWSRDNGSMVTRWTAQDPLDPTKLTVESSGRDEAGGLAPGQWIELIDDDRELEATAGLLVEILDVDDRVLTIDPDGQGVDLAQFGDHPKVRRWDMPDGLIDVDDGWIPLEGGIEVHLEAGTYRLGDFWLIPARAYMGEQLGEIEWPRNAQGDAASKPPQGVVHHYCQLAWVELSAGTFTRLSDCRRRIPSLSDLVDLQMIGGDGQEAMPGEPLPCPLSVVVRNGGCAVGGRTVRFEVAAEHGRLAVAQGGPGSTRIEPITDDDGSVSAFWTLPQAPLGERPCLRVAVHLLDAAGNPLPPALTFHAAQSIAGQVYYDPSSCRGLREAPQVATVQEGLDALWCNPTLLTAGGQGQQGAPGQTLPCALQVAVRNGRWPVEQQAIRFSFQHEAAGIEEPNGWLNSDIVDDPTAEGSPELIAVTDRFGVAQCFWTLPQEVPQPRRCLRVFAHLLGPGGQPTTSFVVFNGDLMTDSGADDVVRIEDIMGIPDNGSLLNDDVIPLGRFAPEGGPAGLIVACDRPIEPQTITDPRRKHPRFAYRPNVELEILVPQFLDPDGGALAGGFPRGGPISRQGDFGIAAYAPLLLNLDLAVRTTEFHCRLTDSALEHVRWLMSKLSEANIDRLLVRLRLDGNFIWQLGSEPPVYLDAEAFGRFDATRVQVVQPRGDRRSGGSLSHWFWLSGDAANPAGLLLTATVDGTTIRGRVSDAAGAPLPAGNVVMAAIPPNTAATRGAVTDLEGNFRFLRVPRGRYRLTTEFVGLPPAERVVTVGARNSDAPVLTAVDGIGPALQARLRDNGIDNLEQLAAADPARLATLLSIHRDRAARFIRLANRLLADPS